MKKINSFLIYTVSLLSLIFFFKDLGHVTIDRLLPSIAMVLVLFIPRILRKFKIKMNDTLEFTYLVFVIIAQFFGSVINLYNKIWWWDVFAHSLSGLLTAILALLLLKYLKIYDKKNVFFNVLFMIAFTLMVASLWEFIEFGIDNIMHLNTQHSIDTGVRDTMEDMLCGFLGSVVISFFYVIEEKKSKYGFIKKILEEK